MSETTDRWRAEAYRIAAQAPFRERQLIERDILRLCATVEQSTRVEMRQAVTRWRDRARSIGDRPPTHDDYYDGQRAGQRAELSACADELEALI